MWRAIEERADKGEMVGPGRALVSVLVGISKDESFRKPRWIWSKRANKICGPFGVYKH